MIAEIDITQSQPRLLRSYEWGLDVSETLEGAGGVGGLVVERCYRVSGGTTSREGYAPCYDGNGNVMELVSLSLGEAVGQYEYGAFGETISVEGDWAVQGTPVRFSTKYWDAETGLVYDTHRYYEAATGRWRSKDPIGEEGGVNLYGMVGNDAVNNWDVLGMQSTGFGPSYGYCRKPTQLDMANHQFEMTVLRFVFSGMQTVVFGENEPWTKEMEKKAVYVRMRNYLKTRAKKECNKKWGNDGQGFVGAQLKWDDDADEQPWYQPFRDAANYVLGFELKSSGSVKGRVNITDINCCCGTLSFRVPLTDTFRLGSLARIHGKSPILPDTELLPDNWGMTGNPAFQNIYIRWEWQETIKF